MPTGVSRSRASSLFLRRCVLIALSVPFVRLRSLVSIAGALLLECRGIPAQLWRSLRLPCADSLPGRVRWPEAHPHAPLERNLEHLVRKRERPRLAIDLHSELLARRFLCHEAAAGRVALRGGRRALEFDAHRVALADALHAVAEDLASEHRLGHVCDRPERDHLEQPIVDRGRFELLLMRDHAFLAPWVGPRAEGRDVEHHDALASVRERYVLASDLQRLHLVVERGRARHCQLGPSLRVHRLVLPLT
mmetsp:Transcript_3747/g.15150  ORF Transcript_3747/g.15150 Transcript_3747/m.15150 type:complete len:249 (+) Transcript_3747:218-964(+)